MITIGYSSWSSYALKSILSIRHHTYMSWEYRFEWPYHLIPLQEAIDNIWVYTPRAISYLVPHLDNVTNTNWLSTRTDQEIMSYLLDHPEKIDPYYFSSNPHPDAVRYCNQHGIPISSKEIKIDPYSNEEKIQYILESHTRICYELPRIATCNHPLVGKKLLEMVRLEQLHARELSYSPCPKVIQFLMEHPVLIAWDVFGRNPSAFKLKEEHTYVLHVQQVQHIQPLYDPHPLPTGTRKDPMITTGDSYVEDDEWSYEPIREDIQKRITYWRDRHRYQNLVPIHWVSTGWGSWYHDASVILESLISQIRYLSFHGIKALRHLNMDILRRRVRRVQVLPYAVLRWDRCEVPYSILLETSFVKRVLIQFLRHWCPTAYIRIEKTREEKWAPQIIMGQKRW